MPSTFEGETGDGGQVTKDVVTIPIVDGACHLVAEAKGQTTRINPSSESPPDVALVADFKVSDTAGALTQVAVRCGTSKCLSAETESPSGFYLVEINPAPTVRTIDRRPVPFQAGRTYRVAIVARGDQVRCYLDGQLVAVGTTNLDIAGFATVGILNGGGSGPAVLDLARFYVFAPGT